MDIHVIKGGPSFCVNEQNPNGQWQVDLYYYLCLADYQADPTSNIPINDPDVPLYFMLQNVPHMSPVDAALVQLQAWWPTGTLVPE